MPELPEVETIVGKLRADLIGRTIASVQVLWARSLAALSVDAFSLRVVDQMVHDLQRRGKYVLFHLSRDTLIIHLRMSGDLWVQPIEKTADRHDRLILILSDGNQLVFNDARKFGRVWLTDEPADVLGHLGPEPLDNTFTSRKLYKCLQSRRRQLKPLLLDQTFLAGIGNIYADESLHLAHLHPLMSSQMVIPTKAKELWQSIRTVLTEGIHRNGASIDWVYRGGSFQNHFRVYQRTGQPCFECGTPIERIIVGQRGTHLCPRCQKL